MAGDIFFTENLVWSASSNGVIEVIRRAIQECQPDERAIIALLSKAEEVRCLSINLLEQHELKVRLTQLILVAARCMCGDLRNDPDSAPEDLRMVEELIDVAQAYWTELAIH